MRYNGPVMTHVAYKEVFTMKIGVCGGFDRLIYAKLSGFSYLEPSAMALRSMSRHELMEAKRKVLDVGMSIEGTNGFFSPEFILYQESTEKILDYARRNFENVSFLGGSYCVVGSGKARNVPKGMPMEEGQRRFAEILSLLGEAALPYGIEIILEPLRKQETNLIHTLSEGIDLCRRIDDPNVGCLVDFFHFFCNGESLEDLDHLREGELRHVHLARPNADRAYPQAEDAPVVAAWAAKLKEIGYDRRVSLECGFPNGFEKDAAEAYRQARVFLQ